MESTRTPAGMRRHYARMKRDIDNVTLYPMEMKAPAHRMRRHPTRIRRPPGPGKPPEWRADLQNGISGRNNGSADR